MLRQEQSVRFKSVVAAARTSSNAWVKDNLSDLSPYAQEFPDEILWISVYGSRDRGRSVSYTFFMKREYDIPSNARYATFVKEWMNSAGKDMWADFLQDRRHVPERLAKILWRNFSADGRG